MCITPTAVLYECSHARCSQTTSPHVDVDPCQRVALGARCQAALGYSRGYPSGSPPVIYIRIRYIYISKVTPNKPPTVFRVTRLQNPLLYLSKGFCSLRMNVARRFSCWGSSSGWPTGRLQKATFQNPAVRIFWDELANRDLDEATSHSQTPRCCWPWCGSDIQNAVFA